MTSIIYRFCFSLKNLNCRNIKSVLNNQKIQYLGCIPLWSEETYLNNLRKINQEKHETFLKLHEAKVIENEANVIKEKLELEMVAVNKQKQILSKESKDDFKNVMNWIQEKKSLQINVGVFGTYNLIFSHINFEFSRNCASRDSVNSKTNKSSTSWKESNYKMNKLRN